MGMERTANRAADEAHGELFCFLSADDVFEPTYIERLAAALEREPRAAYAYCRPMMFGARRGPMRCLPFSPLLPGQADELRRRLRAHAGADYLAVGGYAEDLGEHAFEWDSGCVCSRRAARHLRP